MVHKKWANALSFLFKCVTYIIHGQTYMSFFCCLNYTAATLTSGFTDGTGQIWLDEVGCLGNESTLFDCPANPLAQHDCAHDQDVGVRCITCPEGAIRLQGRPVANEGRVEICNNNIWGTVCDDDWDFADVIVACFQLGLPSSSK